jgi:hypothetical protein
MRGNKASLYEGGIRVPLIARWPGKVPAGRTSEFATAFYDFLPTAAALAGASAPAGTDGISILPTLLGQEQKPHEYLYWEVPKPAKLTKAVRLGDWKGLQAGIGAPIELYDLKTDLAESKNVAAEHPDVVARIEKIMAEAHTDTEIPKADPRVWQKYAEDNAKLDAKLGIKRAAGEGAGASPKRRSRSRAVRATESGAVVSAATAWKASAAARVSPWRSRRSPLAIRALRPVAEAESIRAASANQSAASASRPAATARCPSARAQPDAPSRPAARSAVSWARRTTARYWSSA